MNVDLLKNNGFNVDQSLELLGDMDTYNDILNEFLSNYSEKIGLIKKYFEENDMPNYAIQVHSLKSDAKYLGITELAEKSYDHELRSKDNDFEYVKANINELLTIADKYQKIASQYINGTASEAQTVTESAGGKAILVADDSNIIRSIAEKMIGTDYKILGASDGQEAIKAVDANRENLIGLLLDLNMPNVNGFEVLKYFKENDLFGKIPVAIITGDDSKETIMSAFDYPIIDVLAKPFNENDINRVISNMKMNSSNS